MRQPYDFQQWIWVLNGTQVEGFAEGDDCVTVERMEDSITHMMGADGVMSPIVKRGRATKVTFKLAATSRSNTYFQTLSDLQEGGAATFVKLILSAKDANFNDALLATAGYFVKPANMGRGEKPSEEEWVMVFEKCDIKRGGAGTPDL